MSLGYALLHSHRIETALAAEPQKLRLDDGADVLIASAGAQGLSDTPMRVLEELFAELKQLGADVESLFGPQGPFGPFFERLRAGLEGETPDIAGFLERAAKFFCELDPLAVRAVLYTLVEQFEQAGPITLKLDLKGRLKRVLDAALLAYEKPFLSGRDDRHAHRGFRAALILRSLIAPLLERTGGLLADLQPAALLRDWVERLPKLESKLLARARQVGCFIEEHIVPLFKLSSELSLSLSASVRIDVDGPQPMAEAEWSYQDDAKIVAFPTGSALWITDLVSSIVTGLATIADLWREGSTRAIEVFAGVTNVLWQAARTFFRLWKPKFFFDHPNFGTWLFTDAGDFVVQMFLHFIGSLADIAKGPNWIMNFGPRIVRYYATVLQPRIPFLFARSLWYFGKYKQANAPRESSARDKVSFARHVWLVWPIVTAYVLPVAWIFGALAWEQFDLQDFGALLGISLLFGFAGFVMGHLLGALVFKIPGGGFPDYVFERGRNILPIVAPIFVLIIAVEAFGNTDPAEKSPATRTALRIVYVVLMTWSVAGLIARIPGENAGARLLDRITLTMWYVLGGLAAGAVLPAVLWNYIINDGRDRDGIFDGLEAGTSPYLLPYPKGDRWNCGQGFHGMYSHTFATRDRMLAGESKSDNHCAYDFNEGFGEKVLAAREGVVVRLEASQENGNFETPNRVTVLHIERGSGHDPGDDQEHAITFASYLHLAKDSPRASLHQFIDRGFELAAVDDTGVSALHHLHFQCGTQQRRSEFDNDQANETVPVLFKDESLRGWRPYGHTDGRPRSARFYTSDNERSAVRPRPMWLRIGDGEAGPTFTRFHDLLIRIDDLRGDGTKLPAKVTLRTSVEAGHFHVVELSDVQLEALLRRSGTAIALQTLAADAGAGAHTHVIEPEIHRIDDHDASGVTISIAAPPSARLLARASEPYNLAGERLVVRVNQRRTEFYRYAELANPQRASASDVKALAPRLSVEGPLRRAATAREVGATVVVETAAPHRLQILPIAANPFGFVSDAGGTTPAAKWSAGFATVALGAASVAYQLKVVESVDAVAETLLEVIAAPPTVVGVADVAFAALAVCGPLEVTVVAPGAGPSDPGVRTTTSVAFDAVTNLVELTARFAASAPGLRLVANGAKIELATIDGGTAWGLELRGSRALAALGFELAQVQFAQSADGTRDFESGVLVAAGRGDVRDSRAVTRTELLDALEAAFKCMTLHASRAFAIQDVAGVLTLSSPSAKLTLASEPAELLLRIPTLTADASGARIGAGTFDLVCGRIEVALDGQLAASASIHGRRALLEATLPSDLDAELNAWFGKPFDVRVDGGPLATITLSSAGASDLLAAAINSFAEQAPGVWIGVLASGASRVLRIMSRTSGSASALDLDFSRSFVGQGPLGFPLSSTLTGGGSVADLGAVRLDELRVLLEGARTLGASRQRVVSAAADAEGIRVNAVAGLTIGLTQAAGVIAGGVVLQRAAGRADQLVQPAADAFLARRAVEPGEQTITVDKLAELGAGASFVRVLHAGDPARVGPLGWPADVTRFNGTTLSVKIDGQRVDVSFSGIAGNVRVQRRAWIRQFEAACGGRVLVRESSSNPDAFALLTTHVGDGARLQLLNAPAGATDALALLGGANNVETKGHGFAPDLAQVTPAEYAAAFDSAVTSREAVDDSAKRESEALRLPLEPFTPPTPTDGVTATTSPTIRTANHLSITSQRSGCASSLEVLRPCAPFDFERSLAHAPAAKASLMIEPVDPANPDATRRVAGQLALRFNDNGAATDLARPVSVSVDIPDGDYSARGLAALIDAACFGSGAGAAAAYPDGSIVIETFARGLLGHVEATSALGLPFRTTRARGWPGAGAKPDEALAPGLRSKVDLGAKKAGTRWNFSIAGATPTTPVTLELRADHTIASLADELDTLLRTAGPSGTRIGVCKAGEDGALYVEDVSANANLMLTVDGVTLTAGVAPTRTGAGWEVLEEPGLGLRFTHVLRTHRFVYRKLNFTDEWSLGAWVRPPTEGDRTKTGAFRGLPTSHRYWPSGHYLLAARAEAAKTDGYTAAGEMVISSGQTTDASGAVVPFVRQARYWVKSKFPTLGLAKFGDEVLVHVVTS